MIKACGVFKREILKINIQLKSDLNVDVNLRNDRAIVIKIKCIKERKIDAIEHIKLNIPMLRDSFYLSFVPPHRASSESHFAGSLLYIPFSFSSLLLLSRYC